MTVQQQFETLRTQRAAEWLQMLREGRTEIHGDFVQWITESPLNLEEFLKAQALSHETRAVLKVATFDRAAALGAVAPGIVEFPHRPPPVTSVRSRRRRILQAAAASLVLAVVAGMWSHGRLWGWHHYSTGENGQRTVELADGSLVFMNIRSELAVRMGPNERTLKLSQGEALFDVGKDSRRPFRVSAADTVVEAVGTQFNVKMRDDGTHVAVVEGKVRITRGATPHPALPAAIPLQAGEAARISRDGAVERDYKVDVAAKVAWSQPELIFDGTSLQEAVERFNRHNRSKPLRLDAVPAESHHYSGVFNAADAESFAALLSRERDLAVEVKADEIVIRGK